MAENKSSQPAPQTINAETFAERHSFSDTNKIALRKQYEGIEQTEEEWIALTKEGYVLSQKRLQDIKENNKNK